MLFGVRIAAVMQRFNSRNKYVFMKDTFSNTLLRTTDSRKVHSQFAELRKLGSSEMLGHKIRNHVIGWTMFDSNFVVLNQARDVKNT